MSSNETAALSVKKSSKASKLAKMNEQERAKYLERKMAEEEESKKKREELVNTFIKMKIGQEQKFASLNNAKLTEKWRTILRECKTAELHDDVKALMDSFSRALQKKDAQIKLLVKELSEAEDQYNMAFCTERELMYKLSDSHRHRLQQLLQHHMTNSTALLGRSRSEVDDAEKAHKDAIKYLEDVIIASNQKHEASMEAIRSSFQDMKDEARNKTMEEKQAMQIQLDEVAEGIWQHMKSSLENYRAATEEKRRVYNDLMIKDKKGLTEVMENNRKITKLTEDAQKLRDTLSDMNDLEERKLGHLRRERDKEVVELHQMRAAAAGTSSRSREERLKQLSLMVDRLQKKVEEIESFQSKAVNIAEKCWIPVEEPTLHPADSEETKISHYLNRQRLHLEDLRREQVKLKTELDGLKRELKSKLKQVAHMQI